MKTEITNSQDLIDSRDVIARIDDLRGDLDRLRDSVTDAENEEERAQPLQALAGWLGCEVNDLPNDMSALDSLKGYTGSDESAELYALEELAEQAEGYASDWRHGETLIRDSYFEQYARDLAEDIGAIPDDAKWPCTCIDWEKAADELKMDYTAVEFDGVTYWIR